jgi:hypothetical protein
MLMVVEIVVIAVVIMLLMVFVVVGVGVVEQVLPPALVVPALLLLGVRVGVVAAFTIVQVALLEVVVVLVGTVPLAPTVREATMVLMVAQAPPVMGVIAPALLPATEGAEVVVVHMVTPT